MPKTVKKYIFSKLSFALSSIARHIVINLLCINMRIVSGMVFISVFSIFIATKLISISNAEKYSSTNSKNVVSQYAKAHNNVKNASKTISRHNIYDRSGKVIATNIITYSLYADPKYVINPIDAANKLHNILPEIPQSTIYKKLSSKKRFVWLKRHLSPKEASKAHNKGVPGIFLKREEKRYYPNKNLFSHVVGGVDVDLKGTMGIEKYLDKKLQNTSVTLSLDSNIQSVVHKILHEAIELNEAEGAVAILADISTNEILSMVSLPDYNPNNLKQSKKEHFFNNATMGLFEPGSTFKAFTIAMGLEHNLIDMQEVFDISKPFKVAKFRITDYRPKHQYVSVPEILMFSSNIGTANVIDRIGVEKQISMFQKLKLFDAVDIELPEVAKPIMRNADNWKYVDMITASFGHGFAITPLHIVRSYITLINGGAIPKLTLVAKQKNNLLLNKHTQQGMAENKEVHSKAVISPETSESIRKILQLVVTKGTGRKSKVPGYRIAGKSGSSEKVENGKYLKNKNVASFIAAFPAEEPKYILYVMIDSALKNKHNKGFTTGGMIAAPIAGEIVKNIAPILGIYPEHRFDLDESLLAFYDQSLTTKNNL